MIFCNERRTRSTVSNYENVIDKKGWVIKVIIVNFICVYENILKPKILQFKLDIELETIALPCCGWCTHTLASSISWPSISPWKEKVDKNVHRLTLRPCLNLLWYVNWHLKGFYLPRPHVLHCLPFRAG